MWDFDPDEWLFFVIAGVVGIYLGVRWYVALNRRTSLSRPLRNNLFLGLVPPAALLVLLITLQLGADPVYVAGHLDYTLLFLARGALWIFVAVRLLPLVGLSFEDDVVDRSNPAAAIAVSGAILGTMLAYAGSNIGNGPTIWTTLVPALVATITLFGLWSLIGLLSSISDVITIDRDRAAAIRLAIFLICCGAILGRAMAGDFSDWTETFATFVLLGWPSILLVLFVVVVNWISKPTPQRPEPSRFVYGVIPASILVVMTLIYLLMTGLPEVAPLGVYKQ